LLELEYGQNTISHFW